MPQLIPKIEYKSDSEDESSTAPIRVYEWGKQYEEDDEEMKEEQDAVQERFKELLLPYWKFGQPEMPKDGTPVGTIDIVPGTETFATNYHVEDDISTEEWTKIDENEVTDEWTLLTHKKHRSPKLTSVCYAVRQ